MMLDASARATG